MATVLYRKNCASSSEEAAELEAMTQAGFTVTHQRVQVTPGLVIPRYSLFPFFKETISDLNLLKAKPINTLSQINYILDFESWIRDLSDLTPITWSSPLNLPEDTAFVLRGNLKSRKGSWKRKMFAENAEQAIKIYSELTDDTGFEDQRIYIRKFENFQNYGTNIVGMPIVKEFRFFVCYQTIIAGGYYWCNHVEDIGTPPSPSEVPAGFLEEVIARVGQQCNFYSIDVAQNTTGQWRVVELNLGEQSGLNGIDPTSFYSALAQVLS